VDIFDDNIRNDLNNALKDIMTLYGSNEPLEALAMYCKDYEWDEWFKFYEAGGTREEFDNYMEDEYRKIEFKKMEDPAIAMAFNKVDILIKDYFKNY